MTNLFPMLPKVVLGAIELLSGLARSWKNKEKKIFFKVREKGENCVSSQKNNDFTRTSVKKTRNFTLG